jgi:sec-independent protein translocase protein TatA
MMGLDNPIHIAFLLIVLLLVFGAKRLPEMGHSLGTGLRGFKEAIGGESTHTSLTAEQAPMGTPVQTPVSTPEQTPIGTPGQTPIGTPGQTPIGTPVQVPTPAQAPSEHVSAVPAMSVKDDRAA